MCDLLDKQHCINEQVLNNCNLQDNIEDTLSQPHLSLKYLVGQQLQQKRSQFNDNKMSLLISYILIFLISLIKGNGIFSVIASMTSGEHQYQLPSIVDKLGFCKSVYRIQWWVRGLVTIKIINNTCDIAIPPQEDR